MDATRLKRRKRHNILKSLMKGATLKEACEKAKLNPATFWRWRQDSPRLEDLVIALTAGQVTSVEDTLYTTAINGNVTAMIFFLKNRAPDRWKDTPLVDFSDRRETHHHITNNVKVESNEQLTKELAERSARIEKLRGIAFSKGNSK